MVDNSSSNHTFNARPDTLDFRDKMFVPTLYEVPIQISLEEYKAWKVPVLNQGHEGACTGFGLATVANYLLRRRKVVPDPKPVSPRMLYEMAKRYDEWSGESYEGSSARGAMKGWHKHGVCGDECWPYNSRKNDRFLTGERTSDALRRPLGAYYRVNHMDLAAMHNAMAEVGILYATATVHEGWEQTDSSGIIPLTDRKLGGHAFAIVAYDKEGFWIQNSWGENWGKGGFALITYDDWLVNGTDVWVARLGAPVILLRALSTAFSHSAADGKSDAYSYPDLRPHIISIGMDGLLNRGGHFGTSEDEVKAIFEQDFPRVTRDWQKKRLLLYAHSGLAGESSAVQRLADYRPALLAAQVYPVSFIWRRDGWAAITKILQEALRRRRPEGFVDGGLDFMLDRLDDALEPEVRSLAGKSQWEEIKRNALLAVRGKKGGARIALKYITQLYEEFGDDFEIHLVGHSAGSIFHAPVVQLLTTEGKIPSGPLKGVAGLGMKVQTCTLWAPACTINFFKQMYLPAIKNENIRKFALFTLTDRVEQDDHCGHIYNKSLLYLISNAFEAQQRIPLFQEGEPMLGMEKFIRNDAELNKFFNKSNAEWILSPNMEQEDSYKHSTACHHGDFDDDKPTFKATLARILGISGIDVELIFKRSASSLYEERQQLNLLC